MYNQEIKQYIKTRGLDNLSNDEKITLTEMAFDASARAKIVNTIVDQASNLCKPQSDKKMYISINTMMTKLKALKRTIIL